jgi:arsenate reductase
LRALFVCLHNAGRSQMSQALFEHAAKGAHEARSAGTTPGDRVHPHVLEVMAELGIDLSDRRPQLLTRELAQWADVVVTMGCGDQCPVIPGKRYLDWELPDPAGKPIDEVRRTRDEISRRVDDLLIRIQTTAKPEERVWESPETARARVESSRSAAVDGSSAGARA